MYRAFRIYIDGVFASRIASVFVGERWRCNYALSHNVISPAPMSVLLTEPTVLPILLILCDA